MRVITAVIAIAAGILILGGYFFPALADVQTLLLNWAIILASTAALIGIFNLVSVHADKLRRQEKGSLYSALLLISLVVTFLFAMVLHPNDTLMKEIVLNGIIFPVEASLMGLLTISLLYAALRLLRRRADVMSIVFLVTAVLLLLGSATLPLPFGDMPIIGTFLRPWITQILALGGARGILIGVALGSLTTGLRVLFGADRPYGGN